MPPIRLNRRRFLGCSAAAGLALAQGAVEGEEHGEPVRLGLIGAGNRGTTLLRTALERPGVRVAAVADIEPRHRLRAQGIVEKATGARPEACAEARKLLEREDIEAVLVALPCDLHGPVYRQAIRAGKHLYGEKPLAPTLAECDALIAESARVPGVVVHVGYQRRSNPRYVEGVDLIRRGELGDWVEGRAAWVSSNGPLRGHGDWLAYRARSGDWMVEQAVHVWDLFNWIAGGPPVAASGRGRRDLFPDQPPGRDVTDHYAVDLEWPGGRFVSFVQSWIDPADAAFTGMTLRVVGTHGGLDFASGVATFRDRSRPRRVLHPGHPADTALALDAFLTAVRRRSADPPPAPLTLVEARDATLAGLLARRAVDEGRRVTLDEILAGS